MSIFDKSAKSIVGGPLTIKDDEPVTKYMAESDGRVFWAYNGMEVIYPGERLYDALDEIESLLAKLAKAKLDLDLADERIENLKEICDKKQRMIERLTK